MSDTVIWSENALTVWGRQDADGGFTIHGQDLRPTVPGGHEYEHMVSVAARDVPVVVEALGGAPGADVLTLVAVHTETMVRVGELEWLKRLGIEPEFWSRFT